MKLNLKKKQNIDMSYFGAIRISISSPEKIKELSYGEVKKTETLNYKTLRPERDGLFCEKIFGPVRDFECSCGRYKKSLTTVASTTKKLVCDRCGVEITTSSVRRERMGHINLVVPIAHYWYFGKSPSKIALILDMMQEDVRDIIYGISWVVVEKIDNIQEVVVRVLEKIKNESLEIVGIKEKAHKENIESFWNKIIEAAKKSKIHFDRKFVLSPKNLIKHLEAYGNSYEFIKVLKNEINQKSEVSSVLCSLLAKMTNKKIDNDKKLYEAIIEILSYKLVDAITDDERYVGNLSNNKNYLTAKVLTNAEAIWRLLRDEDLEKILEDIKKELESISNAENVMRIRNLFNEYISDQKKFLEDIGKIELILKYLKDSKLIDSFKDITNNFNKQFINELSDKLIVEYNNKKLPLEVLEILYELFAKYNIEKTTQIAIRSKLITRYKIIESFLSNNIRPEWMVLQVLPVLPADLRPLVPIEGGKFASSDLNELYRRVIHRNNRLKKFCGSDEKGEKKELFAGTPKLIILNEKRLLQEAVDALIENSAKKHPILNSQKRPLKSLTDILKGKQGRFRQNLLGKRVDYSGRSVIVVGPELKLYQCGLPKDMAFELFKPYILYKIMKKYNVTLKKAKLIAESKSSDVWDILEEIIRHHPVLLNRAPTLHRPSIEAFEPVLVEGKSIKIHPMVCTPFNADFDGDQMAVYVPLTLEAIAEARLLMMSYHSLFSPANGKPLIGPTQDIVLGVGYLTSIKQGEKGEGFIFSSPEEALYAFSHGYINLNAKIKVYGITEIKEKEEDLKDPSTWKSYTSVGRIIFNDILPQELRFKNYFVGKKELFNIVQECYHKCGSYKTVVFLDELKKLGYHYATICGFTISVDDMLIPEGKDKAIEEAWKKIKEIEKQAKEGVITEKERYNSVIDIWSETIQKITEQMKQQMRQQGEEKYSPDKPRFNSVYFMAESGARGNIDQVKQLSSIRGLMSRPQRKISGEIGEIIETPVLSNFREGLSILEYFISAHGGRKGLSDTALKTSEAGYLTRRLIDVAHHIVVTEEDCGTINRIKVSALRVGDEVIESLKERIVGRVAAENISYDIEESPGKIVTKTIKAGEMITEEQADEIVKLGVHESIPIRSVLTCESKNGVCAKCYGMDLSTGELVKVGEAVGIVAAQSIGEPGTQLTLRTFHIGGAAATLARKSSIRAPFDGKVEYRSSRGISDEKKFEMIQKQEEDRKMYIVLSSDAVIRLSGKNSRQDWQLPYGSRIYVSDGEYVTKDQLIADWDAYSIPVIATKEGEIEYSGLEEG
ncbi:MAG: DNA-directed RNA polymerase subunit beta', partial [Elusimicrobiota bacterium]|nr:DNA-directed RNA polymerase subunit beta' [Endomicrobiia bacterium]MDW8166261.1 DNA-directed RNA polymerase subunit beta' [Elusimicrobiota bacterium]